MKRLKVYLTQSAPPHLIKNTHTPCQSYVYGCGVRKVWTKEFQNLEKSSQQIKRLKEMLTELGMEGRPTIEKAKAIKAKRDFAQELGEYLAWNRVFVLGSG